MVEGYVTTPLGPWLWLRGSLARPARRTEPGAVAGAGCRYAANVSSELEDQGRRVRDAARRLGRSSSATKDAALGMAAELLLARADDILRANRADLERAEAAGSTATVVDRL